MPWVVRFKQDTSTAGVGMMTATFLDDAGATVFSYAEGRVDEKQAGAFIDAAKAGLAKHVETTTAISAIAQKIEAVLNG